MWYLFPIDDICLWVVYFDVWHNLNATTTHFVDLKMDSWGLLRCWTIQEATREHILGMSVPTLLFDVQVFEVDNRPLRPKPSLSWCSHLVECPLQPSMATTRGVTRSRKSFDDSREEAANEELQTNDELDECGTRALCFRQVSPPCRTHNAREITRTVHQTE